MCGICGFIGGNTKRQAEGIVQAWTEGKTAVKAIPPRERILDMMMTALVHRGPDQGKKWMSDHAALGFRRLAIIDMEGSAQPMVNETGDKVLVFNGEIYNYKELREELICAGHRFSSQGDSEVLLHGYEEWGEELPCRLRGMFAFAIWDEKKRQLFAARDPFGIKPFYYTLTGGCFIFASEIKGILPHPAYRKELNPEALEQYLSFQYSALEKTFFKGIRQLRPGSILKYNKNEFVLEQERYFVPSLYPEGTACFREPPGVGEILHSKVSGEKKGHSEKEWAEEPGQPGMGETMRLSAGREKRGHSEKEWVEKLDQVIKDSVQAHMEADTEIGVFLSGGVDSGLVAAEFTGGKAYTVGFGEEGSRCNEIPLARRLAEQLGLRHKGKQISEREFWEAVPEVLYYMDEPLGDPSAVALYFLAREASRQVRVAVSGEGADELFGGYCIYCEPNALRLYQKLPVALRKRIAQAAQVLPPVKGRSFLIRGGMSVEQRFIGNANLFTEEERRKLLKHPTEAVSPQEFLAEDYLDAEGLDEASRMQYIDLLHWLPGDILQKADRMTMAHSLELRVPYLDREVFQAARCLPAKYKQRGQKSKYLFRKVAGRYLPEDLSRRRKLGFPIPLDRFLTSREGAEAVSRAFSSSAAEKYFNREVLQDLFEKRGNGRGNTNRKLWAVYSFLVWHEIYFPQEEAERLSAS